MNQAILQAAYRPCPECGGQRIVAENTINRGVMVTTGTFSVARAIPVICVNCGYTALYTDNLDEVRKYYLRH